jgi:hypothetical protein
MAITITKVNGQDVKDKSITIPNPDDGKISVTGNGMKNSEKAVCTLVGDQQTQTRHIQAQATGDWAAVFEGFNNNTNNVVVFLLTCKATTSGTASLEIDIQAGKLGVRLAFGSDPPPNFGFLCVTASGTVVNGIDPVSCTLTPINEDGTVDRTRPPPQTRAGAMNGNDWTVMFTPTPPSPPNVAPNQYNGLYLLEATAANEGTISTTGPAH